MEFPHLLQLIRCNQFDTIYHEHFSYFSLLTVMAVFQSHGLRIFDVEEIPTHGGSLRIYACHDDSEAYETSPNVAACATPNAPLHSTPSTVISPIRPALSELSMSC